MKKYAYALATAALMLHSHPAKAQFIDYGMIGAYVQSPFGTNLVGGGFTLLGVTPSSGFNPTNASLASILSGLNMLSVSNAFATIDLANPGQFYASGLPTVWSTGTAIAAGTRLYVLASLSSTFDAGSPWALITGSDPSWLSPSPTDPLGFTSIEMSLIGNYIVASSGTNQAFFNPPVSQAAADNNLVLLPPQNLIVGSNSSGVTTNFTSGISSFASTFVGYTSSATNNSLDVSGAGTVLTNAADLNVGYVSGGNRMVVSNGGRVADTDGYIGRGSAASNNSALVTGAGSLWTNTGILHIGELGISNSLTVAAGGTVAASNIVIAASNASSGTLNIGRFGTNDTAGAITAATIAFGAGTGAINFNQSDATALSVAISGHGAVEQLGSGTTTLSGTNTYTGGTTISAGTLRLANENAAGSGSVVQTTLASLVEFLGGGRMTNGMTVFQYSFANSLEVAGQITLADASSSMAVASSAAVTGSGSFVGTGGLTKKGLGTLSLTAANSFSGPLSVQAGTLALAAASGSAAASASSIGVTNGATLLVSQSHQANNSAAVTLSGGTIMRGSGVSETFGDLNLTAPSFLDFGTGTAGAITFGTYTPSSLLTVNNFLPGNTLVFGSDLGNSITNSSLFSFANGGIGSFSWNQTTSAFTITAIPEPSSYVAALGLLALMLRPLCRHLRGKVS